MKYQITCSNCGTHFLVDAKGGQTIECTCPGCGGTMRVQIPKSDNTQEKDDDDEGYQMGYTPTDNNGNADGYNGGENGVNDDNGDDDNDNHKHRALALGCLVTVVVIAAAAVAFLALNRTTKKPIEDPYEYVAPDTTNYDSIPQDTEEEVVVDTVQVHEEKPKAEAAPVDSAAADVSEEVEGDESSEVSAGDESQSSHSEKAKSSENSESSKTKKASKSSKTSKSSDSKGDSHKKSNAE